MRSNALPTRSAAAEPAEEPPARRDGSCGLRVGGRFHAEVRNPENFLSQQLVVTQAPADLNGTGALTYRYRDPCKRDSSWAYVPALRRVRRTSR